MKMRITITAQRLFEVVEERSLFGRKEYLALVGSTAHVSVYRGTTHIHTETFRGKIGGLHHTSPYTRAVEVDMVPDGKPLEVFATCDGVFTYRFALEKVNPDEYE